MISAENNLLSITVRVTNTITLVFINSFNANRKNKMTMRTIIFAQKSAFWHVSNSRTAQNGLC